MTKYILVGGYPHKAADGGKAFSEELVKGFDEPVILDCLFARPEDNWEKAYAQDKDFFTKNLPEKKLEVILAQPQTFVDQIRKSDAVYFRGGATRTLIKVLHSITGWREATEGKSLAGSSAGADMLCKYYYNLDTLALEDGLGFVDAKMIPHWHSDYNAPNINWQKAKDDLEKYKKNLPIFTLMEGEFVVR